MITVKIDSQKISVKLCKGFSKYKGLMFDRLKDKDGALLEAKAIWMLFTKYPLDLIFIDRERRIVNIQRAIPLTLDPKTWKIYRCPRARWCLELKEGLFKGKVSDKILW